MRCFDILSASLSPIFQYMLIIQVVWTGWLLEMVASWAAMIMIMMMMIMMTTNWCNIYVFLVFIFVFISENGMIHLMSSFGVMEGAICQIVRYWLGLKTDIRCNCCYLYWLFCEMYSVIYCKRGYYILPEQIVTNIQTRRLIHAQVRRYTNKHNDTDGVSLVNIISYGVLRFIIS